MCHAYAAWDIVSSPTVIPVKHPRKEADSLRGASVRRKGWESWTGRAPTRLRAGLRLSQKAAGGRDGGPARDLVPDLREDLLKGCQ